MPLLVCPRCKGALAWARERQELCCAAERIAYPVRDGVPVMLVDEAGPLAAGEGVA